MLLIRPTRLPVPGTDWLDDAQVFAVYLFHDIQMLLKVLHQLHDMGLKLSIDGFAALLGQGSDYTQILSGVKVLPTQAINLEPFLPGPQLVEIREVPLGGILATRYLFRTLGAREVDNLRLDPGVRPGRIEDLDARR